MMRVSFAVFAVFLGIALPLVIQGTATAHEERKVGPYQLAVGWADEPTYVGFKNAVELLLKDAKGKPVVNLGDTLKVEVIFGDQKSGLLTLAPAFDVEEGFGTPGDYQASLIPTRPGTYTFHFVGSIKGQRVDQAFTSSEKTFDSPRAPSEVEFPAKDPSTADLASRVERLGPRVDTAQASAAAGQAAAAQARSLSIVAVVLGVVSLFAARGRRRPA
jgi:hypothetical protein